MPSGRHNGQRIGVTNKRRPKRNVYFPKDLDEAIEQSNIPLSKVCQEAVRAYIAREREVPEGPRSALEELMHGSLSTGVTDIGVMNATGHLPVLTPALLEEIVKECAHSAALYYGQVPSTLDS